MKEEQKRAKKVPNAPTDNNTNAKCSTNIL